MEAPEGYEIENIGYFTENYEQGERSKKRKEKAVARRAIRKERNKYREVLDNKRYQKYLEGRNKPAENIDLKVTKYPTCDEIKKQDTNELIENLARKGVKVSIKKKIVSQKPKIIVSIPLRNTVNIIPKKKIVPVTLRKDIDFAKLREEVREKRRSQVRKLLFGDEEPGVIKF